MINNLLNEFYIMRTNGTPQYKFHVNMCSYNLRSKTVTITECRKHAGKNFPILSYFFE